MNHLERKLAKRAAKAVTYQLTAEQIDQMKRDAYKKAHDEIWANYNADLDKIRTECTERACKSVAVIPMIVAHDKLGWAGIRLRRFLDWMMTWINAINADPETLKELADLAYEYTGIQFVEG